ncbi:MAG: ABC transporter [Paenibacillaceae bacterium ZCTH02-B3]|nr:MAG: ABC transporter [Paenibacillaceae bacterium ZCTH02-B3]
MDCHDAVVSLERVSFSYGETRVIDRLDFRVLERDFVGLTGPNGAGKTTLLKMMAGLLRPTSGDIRLFGQPVRDFRDWHRIGYVPQRSALNPLFPATVREVVESGLFGRRTMFRRLGAEDRKKCLDALEAFGIADLAGRRIGELSGGQQQRVLLARSMVSRPDLLILDEPTTGIDADSQEAFFHMVRHLHEKHRITFVMVTHDAELVRAYLGDAPVHESGRLKFYVRHTHEADDCAEADWSHTARPAGNPA